MIFYKKYSWVISESSVTPSPKIYFLFLPKIISPLLN